jgi:serine/threonine protein kinase
MTPERWQRIEELFDAALRLPAGQRDRFLREQCADDEPLRRELEDMLRYEGQGGTSQRIVGDAAAHAAEDRPTVTQTARPDNAAIIDHQNWQGRLLGPYRLLRVIGSGGMGAVFMAVRDDQQYHKIVAIKTLKFAASDSLVWNRFRVERQVLAGLEHPNIVRLLDGGASQDGVPFIVMDYIAGVPITDFCRQRALSIEALLELFRKVCDAVQYAHQKLIVHRDIKPGNILVTADGVPKLLDFRIAKLLDPEADGTQTMTGNLLMTPEYASPEQVRGEPATTATDVYALGAALFEILTGQRAHSIKRLDPVELVRVVCESTVPAPSTIGGRRLRGDLDNIVLKAMHKEPARRYHSAAQLSEDLQRCLEQRPVLARPDSLLYRVDKYVRRNRLAVAALATVMLSLAGGAAAALHQASIAQARFLQVRKLANRLLFDFDDKIRSLPGSTKAREMLVATALEYLDNLSRDAQSDPELQWELAQAYKKVGDVQGSP